MRGLFFGGLALIFKQIESLLSVAQYFLISFVVINPDSKILHNLLPFRPAADKVMLSMKKGYGLLDFSLADYAILIGNSVLYFSIGLLVFTQCVKYAKKKGLLGQY